MDDANNKAILAATAEALEAANAWRGRVWYEPADLELTLRFGGLADAPHLSGWEATLGDLTISGASTPLIALEVLRDAFASMAGRGASR